MAWAVRPALRSASVRRSSGSTEEDFRRAIRGVALEVGRNVAVGVGRRGNGGVPQDLKKEFLEVFAGPEGTISELKDLDRVLYLMQLRFGAENPGLATILRALLP